MNRYLVLAIRTPEFQQSVMEKHYAFLADLRKYSRVELSGGFSDKTGGAYILKAIDMEEAEKIAFKDPLHTTNASLVTVHEWIAQ